MEYKFVSFLTNRRLTDQNSRGLIRRENHLRAVHIQRSNPGVVFDIGNYVLSPPVPTNKKTVTLKISDTDLYVTARKEHQPAQLQSIPETPPTIDGPRSHILFYWTKIQNFSTFSSVANPELFLATHSKSDHPVFMATGEPAFINFLVGE